MNWLKDVFYVFPIAFASGAFLPALVCGIFIAWIGSKTYNIWIRIFLQLIIAVLQGLSFAVGNFFIFNFDLVDIKSKLFFFLVPFFWRYPYINTVPVLFFWFPAIMQLIYANTKTSIPLWKRSLIGVSALVVGCIILFVGGWLVGAETD
jgi:hypothetical protein